MLSHQQIHDDLRGVFRGTLRVDVSSRVVYASDASPFYLLPHAVAVPVDDGDLRTLVKYASDHQLPLIPRGAGTGLAGESLGSGVVVDMSVHFRKVLEIGADWVRAQVGVTHAELNAALAPHGRRFAPNPTSSATCTVGGMVGTNASGGNVFRHGYTRDYVLALQTIWDTGETATVTAPGFIPTQNGEPDTVERGQRLIELRAQTAALLAEHRELIQLTRPQTAFNRCGYILHDVLTPKGLDIATLLVGSEGTLAFTTEATLRTIPLALGTCQFVLGFATVEAATKAGLVLRTVNEVVGCDLLDQRLIALSRSLTATEGIGSIPPTIGAALIVAIEAESESHAIASGNAAVQRLQLDHPFGVLVEPSCEAVVLARVQRFYTTAVGGLYSKSPGPRPVACVEDVAVPAEELSRFLRDLRAILHRFDLTASIMLRVLAAQVQIRPLVDLTNSADRQKLWSLAEAIHSHVIALGGTISTQHGTGIARTPWVEKQYEPLMPIFAELKRIYDPKNILNPGKLIAPDPSRAAWPFRAEPEKASPRQPLLLWTQSQIEVEVANCNSCGDCRTRTVGRMCPVFHATGSEAATPRAKANLMRAMLSEPTDKLKLSSESVKAVAELCVNCKMCRTECRGRVDIPKLMLEAKAAYHAENGLDRDDWVLARMEGFTALASSFAFTTNLLLWLTPARWLTEKIFGIARRRTLPKFASRTFLQRVRRLGARPTNAPNPATKVAYFVDTFANYNDTSIGLATVAVLQHNGIDVHVPRRQRGCGMAPLAQGDIETARDVAAYNIRTLAPLAREGYRIVCSEPTAAVALTQDYLDLLDSPDAKLVAESTTELTAFLWELHEAKQLRTDFEPLPLTLGHHVPCHVKALPGPIAGPKLLALIPALQVETIDKSCSGMAGTYGLNVANYGPSLIAGEPMLAELRRTQIMYGSTECATCRMQMQDGSGKRTLHPVQYLALAYGLMPELRRKLGKRLGKRTTD